MRVEEALQDERRCYLILGRRLPPLACVMQVTSGVFHITHVRNDALLGRKARNEQKEPQCQSIHP